MTFASMLVTRRHVLAAATLLSWPLQESADLASSRRMATMPSSIRTATPRDVAAIVALPVQDAEQRRKVDPSLWRVSVDAPGRIAKAIDAVSGGAGGPMREL
jgi:hypothetical protein